MLSYVSETRETLKIILTDLEKTGTLNDNFAPRRPRGALITTSLFASTLSLMTRATQTHLQSARGGNIGINAPVLSLLTT